MGLQICTKALWVIFPEVSVVICSLAKYTNTIKYNGLSFAEDWSHSRISHRRRVNAVLQMISLDGTVFLNSSCLMLPHHKMSK